MPRRNRPPKREIAPDVRYDSVLVAKFINRLMKGGKKSTAAGVMYDAFDIIEARSKRNPLEVFEQALQNAMPVIEVKPRRVGGSTYQIPGVVEVATG
jgi:small subunit ribosomal protein S7